MWKKLQDTLDRAAAFTLFGGIDLVWLCRRGATPQLWQATIGQVQVRLMAPSLLHVLIMQSKQLPQLLVLYTMYLQASREEQLQQSAHLHAAGFYWGTVV